MNKNKQYYKWMFGSAGVLIVIYYAILLILKTDEIFFLLLALVLVSLAITTWIFDYFDRKSKRYR
jgi:hypothetical protein